MNNNTLILALAAVCAVLVMNKAKTATAPAGTASAPIQNTNVNDQLWKSLLGNAWTSLRDAQNPDGSQAFLMKNFLGQTVTSDGKPVGQEYAAQFPATFGLMMPTVDTTMGGTDYASSIAPASIDGVFF
jgi:hypothetical protein